MKDYCIKEGYSINEFNLTNDNLNKTKYWNKKRILSSQVFQFHVYKFLNGYIKKNKINRLIDIGCGIGSKLKYINKYNPSIEIIGIDQEDPIEYCNRTYDFGKWISDDFENPRQFENIKSKLIVCCDVIEHMNDPDLLLAYIKMKLEKDGIAVISTPERDKLRGVNNNNPDNKFHIREWNSNEFRKYMISHDFEIVDHFFQLPLKLGINLFSLNFLFKRVFKLKPLKYNQIIVVKTKK